MKAGCVGWWRWWYPLGIVLCLTTVLAESPSPTSTEYQRLSFSLLDTNFDVVLLAVEFNQPLHIVTCTPCLPGCSNKTQDSDAVVEEEEFDVVTVAMGTTLHGQLVERGTYAFYKVHVTNVTHACHGLRVLVRPDYGDPDLYIAAPATQNRPTKQSSTWHSVHFGGEELVVCNRDDAFEYGTFYFSVFGFNATRFNLSVDAVVYEAAQPTYSTCAGAQFVNGECIRDGDEKINHVDMKSWMYYTTVIDPRGGCQWAVADVRPLLATGDPDLALWTSAETLSYSDMSALSRNVGGDWLSFLTCYEPKEYIIGVYGFAATDFRLTLMTEESAARCLKTPLGSLGAMESTFYLNRVLSLRCPANESIVYACDTWGTQTCNRFWAVAPLPAVTPVTPLNPIMDPIADLPLEFHDLVPLERLAENKLAAVFLVSQLHHNEHSHPIPTGEISEWQLIVGDKVTNAENEPLAGSITGFVPRRLMCSRAALEEVVYEINSLTEKTDHTSYTDFMEDRLKIAVLAASDAWEGCKDFAHSFLSFETVMGTLRSTSCPHDPQSSEYQEDPCCDLTLAHTECCSPRNYAFPLLTAVDLDSQQVELSCASVTCATRLLQDYSFQVNLALDLDAGCAASLERATSLSVWHAEMEFYLYCKKKAFERQYCATDLDCLSRCDLRTHICFFPEKSAEYHFVGCLLDKMSAPVMLEFSKYTGSSWTGVSHEALVDMVIQVHEEPLCTGTSSAPYKSYWRYEKVIEKGCTDSCDPPACIDLSCELPPRCLYKDDSGSVCQREWLFTRKNESDGCEDTKTCNHNPFLISDPVACESAMPDEYFCGLCEGNLCQEVQSFNETECRVGLCTTADQDEFLTAEECATRGRCEIDCGGIPCKDREECQAQRICEDVYLYMEIEARTGDNRAGICLGPPVIDEGGNPQCLEGWNALQIAIGCVSLDAEDETSCAGAASWFNWDFVWYQRESCTAYPKICLHHEGKPTEYTSLQTSQEVDCLACGGKIVPSFNWRAPVWVSEGELIPLEWRRREWVSVNTFGPTLNFDLLYRNIHQSLERAFLSLFSIEPICRYTRLGNYMRTIVCDCSEDGDENCYSSQTGLKIPVAYERVCSGSLSVIRGFPAEVSFESSTLPQAGDCVIVEVYIFPAVALFRASHRELSSDLFAGRQPTRTELVKNDEDVVVGELVGDGAEIVLGGDAAINANAPIRLCVTWKTTTDYNFAKYPVLDFARRRSPTSETLVPLGMRVTDKGNGQTFCTDVVTGGEYFPIIRQENWASTRRFSSVEEGLLGTTAALFFFLFLVTSLVLYRNLMAREKEPILSLRVILNGLLLLFALVRGIYLSLVVSGDDSDPPLLIRYFLIELPTLLFFCVFALVIFTWANIGGRISNRPMARLPKPFLYTMALVGFTFILCVFLFHLLPEGKTELTCAAESDGGSDGSSRDSITKFYQVFIASLAILMCGGALFYGQQVVRSLRQMQSVSAMHQRKRQLKRVSVIALVCAGGFLFHSTLQLVNVFGGEISVAVVFIYMLFAEFCTSLVLLLGTMKAQPQEAKHEEQGVRRLNRLFSWVGKRTNVVDEEEVAVVVGINRSSTQSPTTTTTTPHDEHSLVEFDNSRVQLTTIPASPPES